MSSKIRFVCKCVECKPELNERTGVTRCKVCEEIPQIIPIMNPITSFTGDNFFLSNFFPCKVTYQGYIFPSSENAYQAAKTEDKSKWPLFQCISAAQSKKEGRKVQLRSDWEQIKDNVMYGILQSKFENPELREKLLATGEEELIEGNQWGDHYWGVCKGIGKNKLGLLLQKVRSEIKINQKL